MRRHALLLAVCLFLFVPALAQASVITYDFSGVLASVSGISGPAVGQAFSGSFSYDAATLTGSTGDPSGAGEFFRAYSSPLTWQITTGGQQYTSFTPLKYATPGIVVYEALGGVGVAGGASGIWSVAEVLGSSGLSQYHELYSNKLTLSNMAGVGSVYAFAYALTETPMGGSPLETTIKVEGNIDSFSERPQPTPLPAAVWLLGSGLVGLAGLRKKFMKA